MLPGLRGKRGLCHEIQADVSLKQTVEAMSETPISLENVTLTSRKVSQGSNYILFRCDDKKKNIRLTAGQEPWLQFTGQSLLNPLTCGHKLVAVTERMISQTSGQDDTSPQGGWSRST